MDSSQTEKSPKLRGTMSELVLSARAIEIQNNGGGKFSKIVREYSKDEFGRKRYRLRQDTLKSTGSDYVVFECPRCGKRNNQSMYQAVGPVGDTVLFRCNATGCRQKVEVAKPRPPIIIPGIDRKPVALILPPR
jgi:hypothetical protein